MQVEPKRTSEYITEDPDYPGPGDARLRDSWIHVWALIGFLQGNGWDLADAARNYGIPLEAVDAAVQFYRDHQAEIDVRLEMNQAPTMHV